MDFRFSLRQRQRHDTLSIMTTFTTYTTGYGQVFIFRMVGGKSEKALKINFRVLIFQ